MSNHDKNNKQEKQVHMIEFEEKVDKEVLEIIFRLYDKTFRDLVDR